MRPELPTGTVTFLFTDVEGSTRLLYELGAERYADALAEHRRLIRQACGDHGGVEVDTQGDAFFFAFPTAPGGLAAATTLTESLSGGPIRVRVGLHTGTALLADEGYVGDDVHVAARVAATGHGGQIVVSAATANLADVPFTDLGEHRLKGIDRSVRLFQHGDGAFPPLATISNTNLPRPASSFVGRERELADVVARVREGGARLLTLTGPGGTGKTRLAIEAASSLVGDYPAGTFWIGLASLRDPALVAGTISQTVGARDGLAEHIGGGAMLLLLDNLEQVVAAAPEVARLVQACPHLAVMTTSREVLRVAGEVEYAVPPLAPPDAVSLFCERAQLEATPEIAELCSRLDSLPLAVELAAARTRALSPAKILERLSGRLDLLKGGRDADPRQQTLRATIEWSHDLLDPDEQDLFARLAVFAGGCTLEASEAVAGADIDTLQSLVDKSLLRMTNDRYWMLATIREFAAERPSSRDADLHHRHAEFYRDLAVETDRALRGDDEGARLTALDPELDNIRAALAWAVQQDPPLGAELAVGMQRYAWIRGHEPEQRRWLGALLEERERLPRSLRASVLAEAAWVAGSLEDYADARAIGEEAIAIARDLGDDDITYRALVALADAYNADGQYEDSEEVYREALAVARASGDRFREAATTYNLGVLMHQRGDLVAAGALMTEAKAIAEELGSQEGVASSLIGIGSLLREEGRWEESLATLRDGLTRLASLGFPVRSALGLVEVSAVLAGLGSFDRAAFLLGTAEAVFEAAGDNVDSVGDKVRPQLAAALGERRLAELTAEGRASTLEDAVALALADVD
jgi:predicted ATPase